MRIHLVALGAVALAIGLAEAAQAAPPQAYRDVNCSPTRWAFMSPYAARYPVMPYYPSYPMPMGYYPPPPQPMMQPQMQSATPFQQPAAAAPAPVQSGLRFSPNVLPRPSGNLAPQNNNDAPAEAAVRMRYIELSVSGLQDGDAAKLTTALDKMQGSRGSSVKRKGGGEATVKVWYSDKDPLAADDVVEAVTKLGFKAALAG
jgi:hypothetical protein